MFQPLQKILAPLIHLSRKVSFQTILEINLIELDNLAGKGNKRSKKNLKLITLNKLIKERQV